MSDTTASDYLHHWPAIGAHMGIKPDAARHLWKTAGLPVFKVGKKSVGASKAAINRWLAEREAAARHPALIP